MRGEVEEGGGWVEVRRTRVRFPVVCGRLGGWAREKTSISMELVAKVEEEACRLARKTVVGGESKVGGNQEVGEVGSVDLAGDSMVVAGRAGVFQDSLPVRSNPDETKGGGVEGRGGGSEVVKTELVFV